MASFISPFQVANRITDVFENPESKVDKHARLGVALEEFWRNMHNRLELGEVSEEEFSKSFLAEFGEPYNPEHPVVDLITTRRAASIETRDLLDGIQEMQSLILGIKRLVNPGVILRIEGIIERRGCPTYLDTLLEMARKHLKD